MAASDSLEAYDAELAAMLRSLADPQLRDAWHAATERTEALMAIRRSVDPYDVRARELGVDVIARVDRRKGVLLALRFLGLPEVMSQELFHHPEGIPRRQRAVAVLYRSTDALTAEEVGRSVAMGQLVLDGTVYDETKLRILREHPELGEPGRRWAAFVAAVEAQKVSSHRDLAGTFLEWLAIRLVEDPFEGARPWLLEALRTGTTLPCLTDMLGALGDRASLEEVATLLETAREDHGVVACVFALDPARAFERLGGRLAKETDPPLRRRVLDVLAQDGFQTQPLRGYPSSRPRGWVKADPRWIEPLVALRADGNADLSGPAARALGNADVDLVLARLPQPRRRVPPLVLELLGSLHVPPSSYRRDPVWLGEGRVVIADSPSTLAVHESAPGLPLQARIALPEGVTLPERRAGANDNAWEVRGLYDVALRADGAVAIGAQTSAGAHILALHDPMGARTALVKLPDSGAVFPHALHFGAAGRGALWVALDDENTDVVAAFNSSTLAPVGVARLGASFPPPAWFEVAPHPTEDVGVFTIRCGQDGAWLKVVERKPKVAVRKQKLGVKQAAVELVGFSPDGTLAAFADGSTLGLRAWPALDAPKKKRLDGTVIAGGIVGGAIALTLAEVSLAPSAVELRRFPDGERIAKARYPLGESYVALGAGVLVTRQDAETMSLWRFRAPG